MTQHNDDVFARAPWRTPAGEEGTQAAMPPPADPATARAVSSRRSEDAGAGSDEMTEAVVNPVPAGDADLADGWVRREETAADPGREGRSDNP